jgi:hypothetical protein
LIVQQNARWIEIAVQKPMPVQECHTRCNTKDHFRLLRRIQQRWLTAPFTFESFGKVTVRQKLSCNCQPSVGSIVPRETDQPQGRRMGAHRKALQLPEYLLFLVSCGSNVRESQSDSFPGRRVNRLKHFVVETLANESDL